MLRKIAFTFLLMLISSVCSASTRAEADSIYFLSLSDIHFDPFIACYSTARHKSCPLIQVLREASVSQWPAILAKSDKTVPKYRWDTNYSLLKTSLAAAHDAAKTEKAKFVVVLGDDIGHDFRRYYRKYARDPSHQGYHAFVAKTLQFVSQEIAKAFPDMSVYTVVGNNDTYSRDYASVINGPFYHDAMRAWSPLIKDAGNRATMQSTFPYAGYYAVDRDDIGLKIIALNSVLFSHKAKGSDVGIAAKRQLTWLHQQLAAAKKNKQKVLIAMHIPVGVDVYATLRMKLFTLVEFWKPEYAGTFKSELDEFHGEIVGVLSGHMHSDWFQIMTFADGAEIAMTGTPSISPIFGNNPGFKVYQYSLKDKVISDYYTYYFPMESYHQWGLEYEFNRVYQPNCHTCSLIDGMKKLRLTGRVANQYVKYFAVGSDFSGDSIATHWDPYYWCFTRDGGASAYMKCISKLN